MGIILCHLPANIWQTYMRKLCGTITFERLQILYYAFTQSQQNEPARVHQQHHNPTFEHALARVLNRYSNKHTMENKTTRTKNHWTTPDEYMKAIADGPSTTTKRSPSPLNFNKASDSYCNMYSDLQRTGCTCLGQPMMSTVTNGKDHLKLTQSMKQKTWKRL